MTKSTTYFFEDKPLFGLDVGHNSIRVMEVDRNRAKPKLIGYGTTTFDPSAITAGVIEKPEVLAAAAQDLFRHHLIGDITTRRVAMALPVAHAFTRTMQVPQLSDKEMIEAVQTEAEQYIPAAIDDLYLDYSRVASSSGGGEVFLVAMPKRIVESYLTFSRLLGLEAVLFETSIGAGAQLFARDQHSDIPTMLIDFGTDSADITVYKDGLVVSGTVACGSDKMTELITQTLGVTPREAIIIKSKYGLGYSKKQQQIQTCLAPLLHLLTKEIKRTIRYFEERSNSKQSIGQVMIMGGGANMPGMADYLTNELRLAVRSLDPTSHLDFGRLQPFSDSERMSYATVTGLSMTNPQKVFV